jgi:hypothetical protein
MLPIGHIAITTFILYAIRLIKTRRDFTLAVFGSILPDIIDKPLGFIIFHGFGNGRLIAHTLLFNLSLLTLFAVFRSRFDRLLGGNAILLPLASILHIIEDKVWREPALLLYPFMGSIPLKPTISLYERLQRILNSYHNPYIVFSEATGAILLCFLIYVYYKKLE